MTMLEADVVLRAEAAIEPDAPQSGAVRKDTQIIAIYGYLNGSPFSCPGASCSLPLQPTTSQGIEVEFWAESSFGDTSEHYSALLRVLPWGDFMAPEGNTNANQLWYTDILSSQWRGGSIA